jgi:hypothetical protein
VLDKKLLQREQKPDVPGFLTVIAYLLVLAIAIGLIVSLSKGLRRLERISMERTMDAGTEAHESKLGARRLERDGDGNGAGAEEPTAARSGST